MARPWPPTGQLRGQRWRRQRGRQRCAGGRWWRLRQCRHPAASGLLDSGWRQRRHCPAGCSHGSYDRGRGSSIHQVGWLNQRQFCCAKCAVGGGGGRTMMKQRAARMERQPLRAVPCSCCKSMPGAVLKLLAGSMHARATAHGPANVQHCSAASGGRVRQQCMPDSRCSCFLPVQGLPALVHHPALALAHLRLPPDGVAGGGLAEQLVGGR